MQSKKKVQGQHSSKSTATTTAKGLSLHLGVAVVSRYTYGLPPIIGSCETDAMEMSRIAGDQGFITRVELNASATRLRLEQFVLDAVFTLSAGDSLLITFSGHGMTGQVPSTAPLGQAGTLRQAWCLYDKPIFDTELVGLLETIKKPLEVLIISDSCDSGGMAYRDPATAAAATPAGPIVSLETAIAERFGPVKRLTGGISPQLTATPVPLEGKLARYVSNVRPREAAFTAHVAYIAACGVNQDTHAGATHNDLSIFTAELKKVWSDGLFGGSFKDFETRLRINAKGGIPELFEAEPTSGDFSKRGPFRLRNP